MEPSPTQPLKGKNVVLRADDFENQIHPRRLAGRGDLLLHSGALHRKGKTVALTGESGIGKSTLAAGLHQKNWELLADDTLVVSGTARDPMVQGLFPRLRLKPDSAQRYYEDRLSDVTVDSLGKFVFLVAAITDPVPLDAIFVLAVAPLNTVSTVRLGPSDACFAIVDNSFANDPDDLEEASNRFKLAADLAIHVPVFSLSYPRDFNVIPRVAAAITAALEGVSPNAKV